MTLHHDQKKKKSFHSIIINVCHEEKSSTEQEIFPISGIFHIPEKSDGISLQSPSSSETAFFEPTEDMKYPHTSVKMPGLCDLKKTKP